MTHRDALCGIVVRVMRIKIIRQCRGLKKT
jgi:hypothetical protein